MRSLGHGLGLTTASAAVMFLLVFSSAVVLPVVRASSSASAVPTTPSASKDVFSPQYIILGQLEGSSLVQSHRPRSMPLNGPLQFAATWYTAQDFEQAYGVSDLLTSGYGGKGETIAIIDAYGDPEISQDLATYSTMFNLPAPSLTIIPVGPYDPSSGVGTGWDVETALDVEAAHAMAPYAHINLLIAANASNALFEAIRLVSVDHLGDVASISWGGPESAIMQSGFLEYGSLGNPYADYYFSMGVSEGISFFASTGDSGVYDGMTAASADYPATSPFVTAVGGTTLFLTPTSGSFESLNSTSQYQGETAWSVNPEYPGQQVSSGGGVSTLYPQPYYQAGAITSGFRTVPDVSADANPYTGFVEVLEGETMVIGGTSLASPMWAGMAADLDQYVGKSLGLLNPALYSIYGNKTAYAQSFHQVTSGYNGGYQAGPGYNLVTGMGSPNLFALAAALKSQQQGLSISVSTSSSSAGVWPQYNYGSGFGIFASIRTPQGMAVTSGSFSADLISTRGLVNSVPLSFNGSIWVGKYNVSASDPPNVWTVDVTGSSGGIGGHGIADVDIGASMLILSPLPYPFGPPLELNEGFSLDVSASLPDGTTPSNLNLTAYFNYGGKTIFQTPLSSLGGGIYGATPELLAGDPQGTYSLVVNASSFGTVYEFLYFGEVVLGRMLLPVNDAVPSAAPGQQVTFLAQTYDNQLLGLFNSNVTANVYSLQGTLLASVNLQPAPDTIQFGIDDFFTYQEANYTIPSSLTPGFYRLEFLSQYYLNATLGIQMGNFTTGFLVSGPTLQYTMTHTSTVFQGQSVRIAATILNGTGAPVTTGVFFATATPSGYVFESELTDALGITGVPMQYSPALGEWIGVIPIPSALTSPSDIANFPGVLAGPWSLFVTGESMLAQNVVLAMSYLQVLPYTYVSIGSLTPSSVANAPLVEPNGTGYVMYGAAASSLSISGITITLGDDSFGSLAITNATVYLAGSHVGSLSATGSKLVLVRNTDVGSLSLTSTTLSVSDSSYQTLSPALPTISVTGLEQLVGGSVPFTVTVTGQQLVASSLTVQVDGTATSVTTTPSPSGLSAAGVVNATTLFDGVHTLTVTAYQQDGMSSTATFYFSTDSDLEAVQNTINGLSSQLASQSSTLSSQRSSINALNASLTAANSKVSSQATTITTLTDWVYALVAVAVVALALSVAALLRRRASESTSASGGGPGAPSPSSAPASG